MKATWGLGVAVIVACLSSLWAAEKAEETTKTLHVRAVVELRDGSRIVGRSELQAIKVKAAYAELTIPLGEIRSLAPSDDGGSVAVLLANGDKITGTPKTGAVKVITAFGEFSIALKHIERAQFSVRKSGEADATDGLIAWYRFDNEADLGCDSSGKDHHGTNHGAQYAGDGVNDGAVYFAGADQYISVPDHQDFAVTNLTVSYWLKTPIGGNGPMQRRIMGKWRRESQTEGWYTHMHLDDGVYIASGDGTPTGEHVLPVIGIERTEWTHLAYQIALGGSSIFTNGVLAAVTNWTRDAVLLTDAPFNMGGFNS